MRHVASCCIRQLQSIQAISQGCSSKARTLRFATTRSVGETFGQPLSQTHPHLVKRNELTPGISASEYELRRTLLARKVPSGSVIFIPGSGQRFMRGHAFYEFRQNANMFYLTGLDEPDTAMIMITDGSPKGYRMHLFLQPKNEEEEMWTGFRTGLAAAFDVFGADAVSDMDDMHRIAKEQARSAKHIYFDKVKSPDLAGSKHHEFVRAAGDSKCIAVSPLVHRLRSVKSAAEIKLMRQAGQFSGRAFNDTMSQGWTSEAAVQAELRHRFVKHGAHREGYVPVVASGDHALAIHYTANVDRIKPDSLIFVDAGAELGGYLTDISRAWPAAGIFSEAQRDLYQAVLNVEKACIELCVTSRNHSIHSLHHESTRLMKMELRNLGFSIVEGDVEKLFPHRLGHHIGLEIHDCSTLGGYETLLANQTITIEPGLYVPYDDSWPKHFQGMGLRVEDSVVVGEEAPTVLSADAVKEVADIEALGRKWI
ncbi:metallopeptidase [Protomyces lactucae-debilis]|uniref:Metallopeptidase n=1 Tax=Protomyces lactucae-debilis TaxID=2754530 RepID=A0A1Y2FDF0_PROLT|nr:metallopeptidase [Protomyces lactucae-debilis]ORY81454.1 metallopeptidase [Protomyces lactucae-debilis]